MANLGYRIYGHYRSAYETVPIAPAANAVLLSCRWADPKKLFILERLTCGVSVASAVTPQRIDPIGATVQRQYTASETTGFTSFLPTGLSGRAHVNFAAPQLNQLAAANIAAGISGGTRVGDAFGHAAIALPNLAAVGSGELMADFFEYGTTETFPLVLSVNEGLIVSWGATALATGTVTFTFGVEWAEGE